MEDKKKMAKEILDFLESVKFQATVKEAFLKVGNKRRGAPCSAVLSLKALLLAQASSSRSAAGGAGVLQPTAVFGEFHACSNFFCFFFFLFSCGLSCCSCAADGPAACLLLTSQIDASMFLLLLLLLLLLRVFIC
jgi:hypothetical protein